MKTVRVLIKSWTASFRYPGFISGFQPTLPAPPISTIYGLISAAKGELVGPDDISIGYVFNNQGKAVDLENIYELGSGRKAKSNVVKREFLFNPELYLYINNPNYERYFKKPYYPLLLGRSSDLAFVEEIEKIELVERKNVQLGKTILPFGLKDAYGIFQALPTHFTDSIPRKAIGVKPYILMDEFFNYSENCLYDDDMGWGVWFHNEE